MKNKLFKILSIGLLIFSLLQTNTNAITENESNEIVKEYIEISPQIIRNRIENISIKIQDVKDYYIEGNKYGIVNGDCTSGYYGNYKSINDNEVIRINNDTQLGLEGRNYETFLHESFHSLDSYFDDSSKSWKAKYSNNKDFLNIYNSEKSNKTIGNYYLTSSREFFAQCGTLYVVNPIMLQKEYPKTYYYFDELIKSYDNKDN